MADDFPKVVNTERDTSAVPMSAEKAATGMKLPDGFRATLFASEPDVQNPIAMAWDDRSRLWVAENYTYSDRSLRFDLSLRDRVLVFEDRDNDGRADSRKVFLDSVQMLTSVEVGRGGVWLMCPPQLLFVPDADGNAEPDGPAQVVLDGFTVAQDNYHNFANGLRWGPDGWLYGRCGHSCPGQLGLPGTPSDQRVPIDGGIWRYHPTHKIVEVLCHGTTNPWGHDWDRNGELFFINTVIGHLWHMMPGAHLKESFGESMNSDVYQRLDMIADHYHFDTRGNWSESRDGKANDLGGGHAHIGAMIYQSDAWPAQYRDRLFTINMHGRRVNCERLERTQVGYVGRHDPDFLVSPDLFFRGIDLMPTPDGHMLLIDWSDTGECHEQTGVHRTSGRIFKIVRDGAKSSLPFTKPACLGSGSRLSKLWQSYQQGELTQSTLRQLLHDEDEHVRTWAIRLLTDLWPLDTIVGPKKNAVYPQDDATRAELVRMAKEDRSGLVILALASVLQRLPASDRVPLAMELVQRSEFANDRDLPWLVWYGLIAVANEPALVSNPQKGLVAIARVNQWPVLHKPIVRKLATQVEVQPASLSTVLEDATTRPIEFQREVLKGLKEGWQGWRKVAEPAAWKQFSQTAACLESPAEINDLKNLFGDGRALDEIRKMALDSRAEMLMRQKALRTLIDARAPDVRKVCESLLDTRVLNATAVSGLALYDDPAIGRLLASKYKRFQPEDRPLVLDALTSRASFADQLLDVMSQKNSPISASDLTAAHVRQIRSLGKEALNRKLVDVWGELRESTQERRELITKLKEQVLQPQQLKVADLREGRVLFNKTCSQCHQLFGQGKKIGPDLTGAQRSNIDYLLENIVDPSAVVGKDYRMSRIITNDGRVLSGLITLRSEKAVTIQTQTQLETVPTDEIEKVSETNLSPMPDGMLDNLSPEQIRNLIAYLMQPSQVPLQE